jgi:Ran GTPase-activating protein (RanGAP) involved in mRNA processing and transport
MTSLTSQMILANTSEEVMALVKERQPFVTTLKELFLSNCHLEDEGLNFVLTMLGKTKNKSIGLLSLRCLYLPSDHQLPLLHGSHSFVLLFFFFSSLRLHTEYITFLLFPKLIDNKLSGSGMKTMGSFLLSHPLRELWLQGNKIDDEGARFLGEALKSKASSLKFLSLSNNQIGDEGALHLAEALDQNKVLEQLDLEMNLIGDEGVFHLAEVLRCNRTLKILDLKR